MAHSHYPSHFSFILAAKITGCSNHSQICVAKHSRIDAIYRDWLNSAQQVWWILLLLLLITSQVLRDFCLSFPAAFTQPGVPTLANLCTYFGSFNNKPIRIWSTQLNHSWQMTVVATPDDGDDDENNRMEEEKGGMFSRKGERRNCRTLPKISNWLQFNVHNGWRGHFGWDWKESISITVVWKIQHHNKKFSVQSNTVSRAVS